jgi:hypothetical protein
MYRILSVDGQETAEKLLNETVDSGTELVHCHIETVQQDRSAEQANTMLGVPVSRFTFVFRTLPM